MHTWNKPKMNQQTNYSIVYIYISILTLVLGAIMVGRTCIVVPTLVFMDLPPAVEVEFILRAELLEGRIVLPAPVVAGAPV